MTDRKTVMSWLEGLTWDDWPEWHSDSEVREMAKAALELLKEQEAVEPERQYSSGCTTWWNVCGNCRTAINPNDKYCHECGRPVKWE